MNKIYKTEYIEEPEYFSVEDEGKKQESAEERIRRDMSSYLMYVSFLVALLIITGIFFTVESPDMNFNNEKAGSLTGEWQISHDGVTITARLPLNRNIAAGSTVAYSIELPGDNGGAYYNSVMFRALHEYVRVWLEDELLYEFGYDQKVFFSGKPNNGWLIVRLPEEFAGKTLRIEKNGYFDNYAGKLDAVYIGTKNALVFYLLDKYMPILFINLCIILISIALLFISFFFKGKHVVYQLRYLSTFSLITSIWLILESGGYQLFAGHPPIVSNVLFIVFSLIPIAFIRFLLTYECFEDSKYMRRLLYTAFAAFLLIHLMQLTGAADYLNSIIVTHVMIVLAIGGIIGKCIQLIMEKRMTNRSLFVSCLVFGGFVFVDLVRYYVMNPYRPTLFCQMGLFCFFFILCYFAIRKIIIDNENSRKKIIFQQMAYLDLLTGLPNRNAFEREMEYYRREKKLQPIVLVADLNGLKSINDSFGHSRGDRAIVIIGHSLRQCFGQKGHVFRIGGDEFCVMFRDIKEEELQTKLLTFEALLKEQQKYLEIPISVAIGFAKKKEGESVDKAFNAADSNMYENKREMKSIKLF